MPGDWTPEREREARLHADGWQRAQDVLDAPGTLLDESDRAEVLLAEHAEQCAVAMPAALDEIERLRRDRDALRRALVEAVGTGPFEQLGKLAAWLRAGSDPDEGAARAVVATVNGGA